MKKRKPNTWSSIYLSALRRGLDHGYAAYLAYEWENRQQKKAKTYDILNYLKREGERWEDEH